MPNQVHDLWGTPRQRDQESGPATVVRQCHFEYGLGTKHFVVYQVLEENVYW